jgi:hypothetical protein
MAGSICSADYDAAAGSGIAAAGSFGMVMAKLGTGAKAGTILYSFGPWGWASFAVTVIGTTIAFACKDTDLEKWAKHGPFALNKGDRWTHRFKSRNPHIALEGLMGTLLLPAVSIGYGRSDQDEKGGHTVVVECRAPGFEAGVSELIVQTTAERTYKADPVTGRFQEQMGGFMQIMQTPYRIEQIENDITGQVLGARYYYKGDGPAETRRWRTRVRHVAQGDIAIPPLWGRKDRTDPSTIGVDKINLGPVGIPYESQPDGWVYAELWLKDK